jgi:hypothetical protein
MLPAVPALDSSSASRAGRALLHTRGLVALVALTVALGGCAALFVRGDDVSDDERQQIAAETAPYLAKGTGSISGVVRLDTDYGAFVASRNTQVALTPATTIARERFEEYVVEDNELPARRKAEMVLFTQTNAAGRFHFENLPPGDYLLASPVRWSATGKGEDAHDAVAYARVHLTDGEHADVVVTRPAED